MRFAQNVTVVILCLLALQVSTGAENATKKSDQPRGRIDDVVRFERLPEYVHNVAKELKRGAVEQDMETKQFFDGSFECYRESVIRFTWYSVNRVYCQIGFGEYNQDGSYKRKIILQGWLTRAS